MKVSSSSRQPVQRQSERPTQVNRQARDYARLAPDQKRSAAITRKPMPKIQKLGSRIDVRA